MPRPFHFKIKIFSMALYETVFIARQDLSADDVDALTGKFTKIITDGKGKIVSREYWGLRNLAFKVKKNSRGHYVLLNIKCEYPVVAELNRVMSYNEDIIRSAIFNVESHRDESSLFASQTAKDYKPGKSQAKPNSIDSLIDQIQIDI